MFEKSRRKIVATIMSILVLLWIGTLGIIYGSSYIEMSRRNTQMLMEYAKTYDVSQPMVGIIPGLPIPGPEKPGFITQSPIFRLSTFYSVILSDNGDVLEIRNEQPLLHSDDELEKISIGIFESKKTKGIKNDLSFYKEVKTGYTLIVFMDNTFINESAATLFRYTLIFGAVALFVFFFVSVFFAKKIVGPLEESYRKQKQFISDASHELKTPVSVISANAELLSRETENNQWLSNIQYENERMGILVGQLLDLARTENITPTMEIIDFSRLCNGELLPFESVAYEKGLSVVCNISQNIFVEGNRAQLSQLVSILTDNALRHNCGGNEIYVNLTESHRHAVLSVINQGESFSEEQKERIFERFYRTDEVRNSDDNHYGLGLAIAKSVVQSHKGKIEVFCYNGFVEFRVTLAAHSS